MTGGALNLSLLSRGVGEVQKNGHEKVEVFLEPEDYYNFANNSSRIHHLPPIPRPYPSFINNSRTPRDNFAIRIPKTFTTRKGALLLFSEDLAQRSLDGGLSHRQGHADSLATSSLDSRMDLRTVEDLARSILTYGSRNRMNEKVYLKFVHARNEPYERQMRPGFSAKRYLYSWTRNWDDGVFENVVKSGYMTEQSIGSYSMILPNLRKRLLYEDLSHMPKPYRLMRTMLMAPYSMSGYSFYRDPTVTITEEEEESETSSKRAYQRMDPLKQIRVVKGSDGYEEEVDYSDLDRDSQKEVITDLLVKSAVHFALQKQEEMYEDTIRRALQQEQGEKVTDPQALTARKAFDMQEAVESLLESHHGRFALGDGLPEIDDRSHHGSEGSFKGTKMRTSGSKQYSSSHKSSRSSSSHSEREYIGSVPVAGIRDMPASGLEAPNQHYLPPIRHPLSPIKDVSREGTQTISLPPIGKGTPFVNIEPATPMHSNLDGLGTDANRGLASNAVIEEEAGVESDAQSRTQHSQHSSDKDTPRSKLLHRSSQQSLKKAPSSKGSVIMAPGGEVIHVGGSVSRQSDVANLQDVSSSYRDGLADDSAVSEDEPDEWKINRGQRTNRKSQRKDSKSSSSSKESDDQTEANKQPPYWQQSPAISFKGTTSQRSSVTEKDLIDTLTDHAQKIAENVLSQPESGSDLHRDVKEAIEEIMKARSNSAGPTTVEYRDLIKKSLASAVARAAGVDPETMSEDMEISPELVEALASNRISPDQIEIITKDGRTIIQSRGDLSPSLAVEEGHLYIAPGKSHPDSAVKKQVSIPSERGGHVGAKEYVDIDRIAYQGAESVSSDKDKSKSKSGSKSASPGFGDDEADDVTKTDDVDAALEPEDEFTSAVKQLKLKADESKTETANKKAAKESSSGKKGTSSPTHSAGSEEKKDVQSAKTLTSQKSDIGKKKKSIEKEEPFIVGRPRESKPKREPFTARKDDKKPKKGKKGKKGKKEESTASPEKPVPSQKEVPRPVTDPVYREPETSVEDYKSHSSPGYQTEESGEFQIIRELSSPDARRQSPLKLLPPTPDEQIDEEDEFDGPDEEDMKLKSISNKEARAAKRAAAAAKRKEEVERKRREKEEMVKREREEIERQIALQKEMEEERRRREEERRNRKDAERLAEEREKLEQEAIERRLRSEEEREKRMKEEYLRKLEEMKRKQQEEETRRIEEMLQLQREEDERRLAEELMLSKMAEQERIEYEKRKKEEEEERKRKEEELRKRREEEAAKAMEEARLLAEEMERRKKELEERLKFNRSLMEESNNLGHAHSISHAFTFSYFDILQWLGLELPDFEFAKLADF